MAQLVTAAAGAAVGFVVGGPAGAAWGWSIGALVGGLLFPPKNPGPQINDLRIQNSAYGQPIPWLYGMFRLAGNVIWAGQPVQSEPGGKGGGKMGGQSVVHMSFAVALCEGPITGVRRIWANGKLIFDVSNPSNFEALSGSAQMVTNFTVYPGDENQLPDPTMEAALGIGNVPAHRGLAYVVFNNLDLSPWGNFLPSFTFEVVTQQQPTYAASGAVGWNDTTGGADYFRTPQLTAAGGTALGYKASGGRLFQAVNLNAYAATPSPTPPSPSPYPGNITGIAYGTSDVPGFMAQAAINWAWYNPDGTFMDAGPFNSGSIGAAQCTFVKVGNFIYSTNNYGGGNYPVTKSQLGALAGTGYPASTAGTTVAQSTLQKPFAMVGVTSFYVYAMDVAADVLYQFDFNSLAVTNSWAAPAGVSLGGLGYAISDGQIYIFGGTLLRFDATHGAWKTLGSFSMPIQASSMYAVNDDFFVFGGDYPYTASICFAVAAYPAGPANAVPLSSIVADICTRAGLSPTQYDVSQLTDLVNGFAVTSHMTPRDALSPLMAAFFFDASDADGKLTFTKRGGGSVGTFAFSDLGASNSAGDTANETPIEEIRMQEADLPRSLALTYIAANSDYHPATQTAFRVQTKSNKDATLQVPIVLSDDEGAQKAQSMLWASWLARETFKLATPLSYLQYEPNDVVTLQGDSGSYTVRLTDCQYDGMGVLKWSAVLESPAIYGSTAAGGSTSVGVSTNKIGYSGPTDFVVIDIPPLRAQDANAAGLYTAACGYANNWPGCQVEVSRNGNSFANVETLTAAATIGVTTTALPNFAGGNQPDELSTVTVQLANGTLASVSYPNFLAGVQAAYIGGELVYFRNAVLLSANTYMLSGFIRGLLGTDRLMAGHGQSEAFVLLDQTKMKLAGINVNDLTTKMYFDAFLLNQLGPVNPTQVTLTPQDGCLKPLHPVLFAAAHGNTAGASDISLQWLRQARVNYAWNDGTDVPLDQSSESYLLTVSDASGNVKRRVTVLGPFTSPTLPNYDYTAAQITADGFTAGQTINLTVAQNSDLGVLGWPATTSIVR